LSRAVEVVRTYLELRSPEQLRAAPVPDPAIQFVRRDRIATDHYRRLYQAVGDRWHWHDRNAWSDDQLAAHLSSANISVWECVADDKTAGFFELAAHDDGSVEIAYFGLVEEFMGRGIGKAMLTQAAQQAWRSAPRASGCTPVPSTLRAPCPITLLADLRKLAPRYFAMFTASPSRKRRAGSIELRAATGAGASSRLNACRSHA